MIMSVVDLPRGVEIFINTSVVTACPKGDPWEIGILVKKNQDQDVHFLLITSVTMSPKRKQISITKYLEQDQDYFTVTPLTVTSMNQMLKMILILLASFVDKGDILFRTIRPIVTFGNTFQQKILVLLTEAGDKNDDLV